MGPLACGWRWRRPSLPLLTMVKQASVSWTHPVCRVRELLDRCPPCQLHGLLLPTLRTLPQEVIPKEGAGQSSFLIFTQGSSSKSLLGTAPIWRFMERLVRPPWLVIDTAFSKGDCSALQRAGVSRPPAPDQGAPQRMLDPLSLG